MSRCRKCVLSLQYLPWSIRLFSVLMVFSMEEALIISLRNWGISSLLLVPGILACWVFRWRIALMLEGGLLWLHLGLLMIFAPIPWQYLMQMLGAGTVAILVLVGAFGALRSTIDISRETHRLQSQFIANLNHEIRTPLTGAVGAIGLLREHGNQLTASEWGMFLSQAQYGCDEVVRLTSNIKDAIDPRDDVVSPHLSVFRLDSAVGELLRYIYTFEHPFGALDFQAGLQVEADASLVQRVLHNLLHNACKYSPQYAPIAVKVAACEWATDFACVCVSDRGSGIQHNQVSQLFHKFSRLGNENIEGTGLGLYNCRRMVENMGGQIWVESSGIDGEGSHFYFTLPLAKKQNKVAAITKPYPIIDIT
jgi:K+-sensing histidine kinase KdpD